MLPALQQSPMRDPAFFQLHPSPDVACGLLYKSPSSCSEHAESARSSCCSKHFLLRKVLEVSAILVRFVYLDTRKRTTVGVTYYIWKNVLLLTGVVLANKLSIHTMRRATSSNFTFIDFPVITLYIAALLQLKCLVTCTSVATCTLVYTA